MPMMRFNPPSPTRVAVKSAFTVDQDAICRIAAEYDKHYAAVATARSEKHARAKHLAEVAHRADCRSAAAEARLKYFGRFSRWRREEARMIKEDSDETARQARASLKEMGVDVGFGWMGIVLDPHLPRAELLHELINFALISSGPILLVEGSDHYAAVKMALRVIVEGRGEAVDPQEFTR